MNDQVFRVSAQGVDPDLTRSTGLYDPIDLGTVGEVRLEEILTRLSRLSLPEGLDRGEDLCPPRIVISGPRGDFDINLADEDGTLYCDALGGNIGIAQAMMVLTGKRHETAAPEPAARPTHCPKCRDPLDPSDAFCAGCGLPIAVPATAADGAPRRASKKEEKRRKADVQVQTDTGKDLEHLAHDVIGLMANPLPLRQYRERFAFLLDGEKSTTWDTLREYMFRQKPPPPIHARLTAPPCDWALQKPGFFRRLFTMIVDGPVLLMLFSLTIKKGPLVAQALGLASNSTGEGLLMLAFFLFGFIGYYVLNELILGASPGGFLLGLRVVDDYGRPPGVGFLIMRQVWKILDTVFFFLGGLARTRLPPTTHVAINIPELQPGNVVIR